MCYDELGELMMAPCTHAVCKKCLADQQERARPAALAEAIPTPADVKGSDRSDLKAAKGESQEEADKGEEVFAWLWRMVG